MYLNDIGLPEVVEQRENAALQYRQAITLYRHWSGAEHAQFHIELVKAIGNGDNEAIVSLLEKLEPMMRLATEGSKKQVCDFDRKWDTGFEVRRLQEWGPQLELEHTSVANPAS